MTKRERVEAALQKKEVDKIPMSIWYHIPYVDQDPVQLAEESIRITKEYDFDFIKMMPFGNYCAQDYGLSVTFFCNHTQPALERKFGIESIDDWKRIEPLPAYYGTYGKQLQFTQQLQKQLKGEDIPYIQTIFSPLTVAKKLAGPRLFDDMREHPDVVHSALRAIAETNKNFCKANMEAGVAGFFFASQCSQLTLMSEAEYREFGVPYDLDVISTYQDKTYFNVVHIHGDNTMWSLMANYPVQCVNWHDRWSSPTMAEARKMSDKCFLGGINEKEFATMSADQVEGHMREAVQAAGRTGLMLGPGCVAKLNTPADNFYAAKAAISKL